MISPLSYLIESAGEKITRQFIESIPGVGVLTATAMYAAVVDAK
jgi:transposase